MSNKPFFSILIPTYNQAQYLGEALDSVIAQTYTNWEAIIINDGSTDATAEIIEIYCNKDPRFKAIHKENGGAASALNLGLENAQGEWICWLSSDDLFEPNKLGIHQKWIENHPDYKFFFSNFQQLVGTTGKIINLNPALNLEIPPIELQIAYMLRRNYVTGNSICILRDAWLNTGFFDEELRYAQDYDMWIRLMIKYKALFIPEYTYLQRIYPEQESQRSSDFCLYDSAKSTIKILNKYELKDLLPLVKSLDSKKFKQTVTEIIDIAFDHHCFIYKFGFHPLLILRIKQFIDQNPYHKQDLSYNFYKQLDVNMKLFINTPKGIWCECVKKIINASPNISNETFSLSFEILGENYYWWLCYIELDTHQLVLNYLNKFCDYQFIHDLDENNFYVTFNKPILSISLGKYNYIQEEISMLYNLLNYSFKDKMLILEKLDFSLKQIFDKTRNSKSFIYSNVIFFIVCFARCFRLLKQGVFFERLRNYIKYVFGLI